MNLFLEYFVGIHDIFHFKEYAQAVEKLRVAYYPNTENVDAIISGNIGLLSDAALRDPIMKSVVFQAISNNRGTNEHNHRNTFLFRLILN